MTLADLQIRRDIDAIYIVGKGASKSSVNIPSADGIFIISANDSALEIADLVVHTNPTLEAASLLRKMKPDTILVSSIEQERSERISFVPTKTSFELTSSELLSDFFSEEICHQGFTVLLGLRLAEEISIFRNQGVKTYLIGFDFEVDEGRNEQNENSYRQVNFSSQRRALRTILSKKHLLRNSVIHVGVDGMCDLTPEVHNRLTFPASHSATPNNAETNDVEIVAEITTNHFGDWQRLEQMVRRAKMSGADSVKFQKRNVDTFYTKEKLASAFESPYGKTFGDYRRALELDFEGFSRVDSLCREVGIDWFVSILDIKSFDFMMNFEPRRLKLPSTISEHTELLEHVAANFRKEVVVSTGFTESDYEDKVLELFRGAEKLFLLQCVSAYPARNTETQVGVVRHYHDLSRVPGSNVTPGYSSHDIGSLVSMLAVAAGARMIEKHVKYGETEWAHFDEVAVDLSGGAFATFTKDIRDSQKILGSGIKTVQNSEHHKYWI
jgi:sialic acid synthase SpsE